MDPIVCRYVGLMYANWEVACIPGQAIPDADARFWLPLPALPGDEYPVTTPTLPAP